jgi:hypothetical protein
LQTSSSSSFVRNNYKFDTCAENTSGKSTTATAVVNAQDCSTQHDVNSDLTADCTSSTATVDMNASYSPSCSNNIVVNTEPPAPYDLPAAAVEMNAHDHSTQAEVNSDLPADSTVSNATVDIHVSHSPSCSDHTGVNTEPPTTTVTAVVNAQDCSTQAEVNSNLPTDCTSSIATADVNASDSPGCNDYCGVNLELAADCPVLFKI